MKLVQCPGKAEKKAALVLLKHYPVHTAHSYLRYMLESSKWIKKFIYRICPLIHNSNDLQAFRALLFLLFLFCL